MPVSLLFLLLGVGLGFVILITFLNFPFWKVFKLLKKLPSTDSSRASSGLAEPLAVLCVLLEAGAASRAPHPRPVLPAPDPGSSCRRHAQEKAGLTLPGLPQCRRVSLDGVLVTFGVRVWLDLEGASLGPWGLVSEAVGFGVFQTTLSLPRRGFVSLPRPASRSFCCLLTAESRP